MGRKIILKEYKLKQWYPTLPKEWKDRKGIVSFNTISNGYQMEGVDGVAWLIRAHEFDNKDFWELIEKKKPLFITEDGVEIFTNDVKLFAVSSTFITASDNDFDFEACKREGWKLFFHKFNADEYILWNKPLLSLQEIDTTVEGCLPEFDELIKMAEERIK